MPTNCLITAESYSASSSPGSDRLTTAAESTLATSAPAPPRAARCRLSDSAARSSGTTGPTAPLVPSLPETKHAASSSRTARTRSPSPVSAASSFSRPSAIFPLTLACRSVEIGVLVQSLLNHINDIPLFRAMVEVLILDGRKFTRKCIRIYHLVDGTDRRIETAGQLDVQCAIQRCRGCEDSSKAPRSDDFIQNAIGVLNIASLRCATAHPQGSSAGSHHHRSVVLELRRGDYSCSLGKQGVCVVQYTIHRKGASRSINIAGIVEVVLEQEIASVVKGCLEIHIACPSHLH